MLPKKITGGKNLPLEKLVGGLTVFTAVLLMPGDSRPLGSYRKPSLVQLSFICKLSMDKR